MIDGLGMCFDALRRFRCLGIAALAVLFALAVETLPAQPNWNAVGPAGGDARSFAMVPHEPNHLYLGTTNSWIYESLDGGGSWHRLSKVDTVDDLVLDSVLVNREDPATLYAGAWRPGSPDGGLWISHDSGKSWVATKDLHGQSVLALSEAPSDPRMLFAGTLQGVFRSTDAGGSWKLISPSASREVHEVESLAIDPVDPNVIYAGTWHLPWKTTDGGESWHNVKQGLIDDSDVFSIIIDPAHPRVVYLSACSGIYKSESAGALFHKINGIPATARRTRVLMQDPVHPDTVYAGTTEGLYKTTNAGKSFQRMTGPDVIVNDVFVDPRNPEHVLLATDRSGVLSSKDGAVSFSAANDGISGRRVEALLVDHENPERLYAGVVNDKTYGGVFASNNGGADWSQIGSGLEGRDVFALAQASDGTILAGTNHGIFILQADKSNAGDKGSSLTWQPRNIIANTLVKTASEVHYGKHVNVEKRVKDTVRELEGRVNALDLSGDAWIASTSAGLLTSRDHGATWQGGVVMGSTAYLSVSAHGQTLAAARPDDVVISTDGGESWMPVSMPTMLTRIHRVAFSDDGTLWLGAREGVYFTHDKGKTWMWVHRLPFNAIDDLYYDSKRGRVLVSSRASDLVYAIDPKTLTWDWWKTGYRISEVRTAGGRLVAASLFDGVLVEPRAAGAETSQGDLPHKNSVSSHYAH